GMAWVCNNGKVRDVLDQRNGSRIEGVAQRCIEGANATFAEDDVGITVAERDLGGLEKIVDGGHHAALKQKRLAGSGRGFDEREVLHAARADLENVGVLGYEGDVFFAHHLGDDGEAGFGAGFGEEFEAGETETLKCIGRTAGFEGASAKNPGTLLANVMGDGKNLLLGLDRTWTGHGDEVAAADFEIQHPHNRLPAL